MEIKHDQIITLSDGRKLGYAEYGDPKGKPVLYFHGWPSSRLRGYLTHKDAQQMRVRLLSLDRPGYGISTYKNKRTLLDYADDIVEFADQLQLKKFAVVGVSGGGPYAAAVAYKIPQRLTKVGIVVGLAPTGVPGILEGMQFTGKIGWANYSKYPITAYLGSYYWYVISKYLPSLANFGFWNKMDRKVLQRLSKEDSNLQEAFRQGIQGPLKDLFLYTSDWGFNVDDIQAKVYLFYGEIDNCVPLPMGKYYAKHIAKSTLRTYPNEGHLISVTHAKEILSTLAS